MLGAISQHVGDAKVECEKLLDELRRARHAGPDARRAVHIIGSSAALLGARRLSNLCMAAEIALIEGHGARELLVATETAAAETFAALGVIADEFSQLSP